jgi:hypothetical protein
VFFSLKKRRPDGSKAMVTGPPVRLGRTVWIDAPGGSGSEPPPSGFWVWEVGEAFRGWAEKRRAIANVRRADNPRIVGSLKEDLLIMPGLL